MMISCSSPTLKQSRTELDSVYISSGIEQYTLGTLPYWANFASDGKCFRKENTKYLNFENLKKSYNFTFEQSLHLQQIFNKRHRSFRQSSQIEIVKPNDEANIFYNSQEMVQNGTRDFKVPKFKSVNIIWIDSLVFSAKGRGRINRLLRSDAMNNGVPILLSKCLTDHEIDKIVTENKWQDLVSHYISQDFLTVYDVFFIGDMFTFQWHIFIIKIEEYLILEIP